MIQLGSELGIKVQGIGLIWRRQVVTEAKLLDMQDHVQRRLASDGGTGYLELQKNPKLQSTVAKADNFSSILT